MVVRWFVRASGGLRSVQAAFFSFWSCATPGGSMFYLALAAPFALEAFFNLFRHLAWSCSRVRSVWAWRRLFFLVHGAGRTHVVLGVRGVFASLNRAPAVRPVRGLKVFVCVLVRGSRRAISFS